jgi:Big-like domain-containing protein/purple acid phosphatase-like protein
VRFLFVGLLLLLGLCLRAGAAEATPPPDQGPGGPILVISNSASPFSSYYAEILRAEGLNEFTVTDISNVTPSVLDAHDVAILGDGALGAGQAQMLDDWVQAGGNLIAMRPEPQLAGLLGLTDTPDTLANGYLQVNTGSGPGAGIVGQTIQFHGTADRYTTDGGTQTIVTLFSDATTSTPNPAVTLRSVGGNGGQAAAFTYDLARSVVYTRQGNPAWAGDERDSAVGGNQLIRSDDLFFGAKPEDAQPDWVNLDKVAIPQADEQQHLLANLIGQMNKDRKPLPRFWFLPRDKKAAVVMTGDDHGNGGTEGRFDQYEALSPDGCSVADWECVRGTSYIFPNVPTLTDSEAAAFQAQGFEIALHVNTNCADWSSRAQLESFYSSQLAELSANYPSLSQPATNRTHCIAWSDWATQPKVELENGIRLDTTYYYWPPDWVQDRPGLFTGSGMPMRFAQQDGSMIDVYQATTQMTDESGQSEPFTVNSLLDKALGPQGYYGVFTANMHTDNASHPGSDAIVAAAQSRGVPIVSARQMLQWLDGRNGSSFNSLSWNGNDLDFTIDVGAGANGLRGMVPTSSSVGALTAVKRNGTSIPTTTQTIKGVDYAFFDATAGSYEATYAVDDTAPVISNLADAVKTNGSATIAWDTNEASDSRVDYGTNPNSLTSSQQSSALVSSHSVQLNGLDPDTTYYYRVTSSDAASNSSTEPPGAQAPRSFTTPATSLTDTTADDFSAGIPGADAYVSETGNGEVALRPTVGEEFSGGPSLPSGWQSQQWNPPAGSATVSGGKLVVDGSSAGTVHTYGSGRSLEFNATFGGANFQHVGFGVDFNDDPDWAMFSIKGDGTFNARTNNGGSQTETQLAGSLIGSPHRYRIEWAATEVRYFVDGNLVATHAANFGATQMRALASDLNGGGTDVSLDWLHLSPYPAAGTFDSRVFDAGQQVDWGPFGWTADLPDGTAVAMSVRTGNTPAPDGSWSNFTPIATRGADVPGNSRYLQYRAQLSTNDPDDTPSLSEVAIGYTAGADTTAPTIVHRSPSPNSTDADAGTDVAVQFSEPMDPSTIDQSSFRLRAQGAGSDVPATLTYSAATATLNPNADLAPGTVYHVTVGGSVKDANGNALGADDTWTFTTAAASLTDTMAADFNAGNPGADTYVSETGNGEVILRPTVGAEFSGGPLLPLGWSSATWESQGGGAGGSATLAGGALHVNGAYASTDQTFGPGHALEFVAIFNGATFQHAGLSDNFQSAFAIFSTKDSTSQLYARTNFGSGSPTDTALSGSLVGTPHLYRLEWDTNQVRFFVDGNLVATHSGTFGTELRAIASDFTAGGPELSVDWVHVTPYPASGTFDSRVFDAGQQVDWNSLSWTVDTPAGTGVALSVRTGNTPTPDGSWSGFNPVGSSGGSIGGNSRYLQYRAELSSSDQDRTPTLSDVTASYAMDTTPPATPQITDTDPGSPANDNNPKVKGTLGAGDPTTVKLYENATCQGAPDATGTAAEFTGAGIAVSVPDDATTTLSATAADPVGNDSGCSDSFDYREDSTAPETQIDSGPTGTTSNATPTFTFSAADEGSSFQCRLDSDPFAACSGPGASHTPSSPLSDGPHTFQVRAIDAAQNPDQSPASSDFTVDTAPPAAPQITDTDPNSPANDNNPKVKGTAAAGSTVKLYKTAGCTGAPVDSGSAAQFASPGLAASVADNTTTSFRATATDAAGNASPCSAARNYVEDSTAPETTITGGPSGSTTDNTPTFTFTSSESGSTFRCRFDSQAFGPCSGPGASHTPATPLSSGVHSFEVRAIDRAKNPDPTPAKRTFTVVP